MDCDYQAVDSDNLPPKTRFEWKPYLRQVHIISGVWTMFFMAGLFAGIPTVTIPQLRQAGHTIDDEMTSWFNSISNITAILFVLILPSLTRYAGRKLAYTLVCLCTSAVYLILYFSTTPYEILAAGAIQGFANASNLTLMTMIHMEYSAPRYRGINMNISTANFFYGVWTANAIGIYFYWKYIAVLGIICSAYSFSALIGPESPMWLVSKGKYKQAEEAYTWLHGDNETSRKEVQDIIKSNMAAQDLNVNDGFFAIVKKKEFFWPLLLCILVVIHTLSNGKYMCSAYAMEVISRMTNSEETAKTGMIILNGITILGMYFGSFLLKFVRRRTLYYMSNLTGLIFIFIISLYLFLVRLAVVTENNIVTIVLLILYSLSFSCGAVILGYSMYSELIQMKYQRITFTIFALSLFGSTSFILKFAPLGFKYLHMDGMFFLSGVICGILCIILYNYLPDTEGKTVVEIEEIFKDKKSGLKIKNRRNRLIDAT